MVDVTEQMFLEILGPGLGDSQERALAVFKNYGEHLAGDVVDVLTHAIDQNKVGVILDVLEEHYDEVLRSQHSSVRGTIHSLGFNPTVEMFTQLREGALSLQLVEEMGETEGPESPA